MKMFGSVMMCAYMDNSYNLALELGFVSLHIDLCIDRIERPATS